MVDDGMSNEEQNLRARIRRNRQDLEDMLRTDPDNLTCDLLRRDITRDAERIIELRTPPEPEPAPELEPEPVPEPVKAPSGPQALAWRGPALAALFGFVIFASGGYLVGGVLIVGAGIFYMTRNP